MKSISNIKYQISNIQKGFTTFSSHERGFTLIELLVTLVIIVFIGTIVVNIITSTFRGTSKTDVINKVRESGNYAISEMTRTLKFGKSFDGASTDGISNWTCDILPPGPPPIPTQFKAVKTTSFDGITTIFSCESNSINANGISIMDTSVTLSTGTCYFTCGKENVADTPTIGINFTIKSANSIDFAENRASIPFTNWIKIRN